MTTTEEQTQKISNLTLPCKIHFIGIGGIGMSGIAQLCNGIGCSVTGSDRSFGKPDSSSIFEKLAIAGIKLFAQDGSTYQYQQPDIIVYSTAIESDNPDFLHAPLHVPKIHRSEAIALCIHNLHNSRHVLAVTGTCGKTTTSAWLADALFRLHAAPGMLTGGAVKAFRSQSAVGNGCLGSGPEFIIEADESDKSLLNYVPSTAIILNIGTDHYSREELCKVFRSFANSAQENIVIQDSALKEIGPETLLPSAKVTIFSEDANTPATLYGHTTHKLTSYRIENGVSFCSFDNIAEIPLPLPGIHNAMNALAVYCTLLERGYQSDAILQVLPLFSGVERRFDKIGKTKNGAVVIDDYAHNVEKIVSCIHAAQELTENTGRVFAVFQPHGFSALHFMRQELQQAIGTVIREKDTFCFLPVYYAGGTTTFTPTSDMVADECAKLCAFPDSIQIYHDRAVLKKYLLGNAVEGDIILVLGARDPSLTLFCKSLVSEA